MSDNSIIECIPNFSEGRDQKVILQIAESIQRNPKVTLLNVDPGKGANRTVMTFVGPPHEVVQAAFNGIAKAAELIDMRYQEGAHPRIGATDVCPLVPLRNISLEKTIAYSHDLGGRVGKELGIPVYLYEASATQPERRNLAWIRAGEYENFAEKMRSESWFPDFGPTTFNEKSGATVIGARDFLIAYNVNLNTASKAIAETIAKEIRTSGTLKWENGKRVRVPGKLPGVKAIGWYIEEYGFAQISTNLVDISRIGLHQVFEACWELALQKGVRVTGSELIGLAPKKVLLDAGKYYRDRLGGSIESSEEALMEIAVNQLGLNQISPFLVEERILEFKAKL